jgi:cysteine-rich repeat protein
MLCILPLLAYGRQTSPPESWSKKLFSYETIPVLELPSVDREELLAQEAERADTLPLQFAIPHKVSIKLDSDGQWDKIERGQIWRQRISCPGATDINVGLTKYYLPQDVTVHLYSESEQYYEGAYTYHDNKLHQQLWLPPVPGDRALIEVFVSSDADKEQIELELTHVNCGFRDFFNREGTKLQGDCNIDVICSDGSDWRNQIRSVALYSINGAYLCTGTLIMDAEKTFRNFFLSANHCKVNANNASTLVFYWNYESPTCGQLGGGSLSQNQSGATFRAAKADVDFLLVELDNTPDPGFHVYYSGWDRSGIPSEGTSVIHHPFGAEKAISFNYNALTTIDSCIKTTGINTHWKVDNWEKGTTEKGSSGSCLWDIITRRCVGFLSGGSASCSNPGGYDCFGKFSVAWDSGSTASERLKDWLDPNNTNVLKVDGSNPGKNTSICGNGKIESDEECDDGNILSGDGCSSACTLDTGDGSKRFFIKKGVIKQKSDIDMLTIKITSA